MRPPLPVLVVALLSTALLSAAAPADAQAGEGDIVATGHITIGTELFHTFGHSILSDDIVLPTEEVDSFRFDATGLVGLWLWPTLTPTTSEMHVLTITYLDAAGAAIDTSCIDGPHDHALMQPPLGQIRAEPQCLVPPGTASARVAAQLGADLDVIVVVAPGPQPPSPDPDVLIKVHFDYGLAVFSDTVDTLVGTDGGSAATRADVTGLAGRTLVVEATDHSGLGYDLRLRFRDADGASLGAACAPVHVDPLAEPDVPRRADRCIVPAGAVTVHLSAYHAKDVETLVRLVGAA